MCRYFVGLVHMVVITIWRFDTFLRANRSFALQANANGQAQRFLVQDTSVTLSWTSAEIERMPEHATVDKTTAMMINIIPGVIKDVLKVQN